MSFFGVFVLSYLVGKKWKGWTLRKTISHMYCTFQSS